MYRSVSLLLVFILVLLPTNFVFSAMSSTNYKIQTDDFATGGLTSSTNYAVLGSAGDWQGLTSSTNYGVYGGYVYSQLTPTLSISLDSSSVALGTLSVSSVASVTLTATISTDAPGGYSLMISEDQGLTNGSTSITDVADGTVSAGSEEYGVGTRGTDGLYNSSDTSITSSFKAIASSSGMVTSQTDGVVFKASISSATTAGSYSHTVTLAAVSNF